VKDIGEFIISWLQKDIPLIAFPTPLLVMAIILITGFICSRFSRKFKIPVVTAQILGGVIIGHYVLNIFPSSAFKGFEPITNFALGFIALTIGSHLDFRKLHNSGKRIIFITVADALITPLIVFFFFFYVASVRIEVSLLVAAISVTTDPASILHVIKELRAKGILSKTLLASVALNNVLTILIFYTVYYYLYSMGINNQHNIFLTFSYPILLLTESVIIGSVVGGGVVYLTEKHKTTISFMTLIILAVVVAVGVSETLHFSGILSSLIAGIIITNFSKNKKILFSSFADLEKEVYTLFFVLAGTHLDFKAMWSAGIAGIIFIVARAAGKTIAPITGAFLSKSTKTIRNSIGISFYPFAGIAIGLVLITENLSFVNEYSSQITAIVLTAVVFYELIGPVFSSLAIRKAGEEDKNRLRLMDFIQEEYIKINLEAKDKWDALSQLATFLYKTHKIHEISMDTLQKGVLNRGKEISTGIGDNIAIPHAVVEGGPKIRGVIGVSVKGIDFDSFDGKPVNVIFLIATPKKHYDLHLHVLANIAKIFGHHPHIKNRITKAKSSAEVFEILQSEEVEDLNPFFEE